jgi:2-aminoadipate transaminase
MQTPWGYRYAHRMQSMQSSAIRELLKLASEPDIISFGGGLPAPEIFPVDRFREACATVLQDHCDSALQYGATEGILPLREMIARHTARYSIEVNADNIIITSGSQQALDLIGKVFINRGDRILAESPTYLGALQAWKAYGADYITVPTDNDGIIINDFEEALRASPKFIYLVPNFQNPTGVTMSLERRKQLVRIAAERGVPIIEDDPYGQLRYAGEHLPTLVSLDSQQNSRNGPYSGNVIYLSTFSKILAPGFRLGSIIAPHEVITNFVKAKQGMDLHTATFNQYVTYEVSKGGFIDQHIKLIRKVYNERRNVMLETLEEHMPPGVSWTRPEGGLFLWLTLPEGINSTVLFKVAVKRKVAFVPGEAFHPRGGGENTMRLNFSSSTPDKINEGIARLGIAIREIMQKTPISP